MKKEFYSFAIAFTILLIIATLYQSILFYQIDFELYQLNSFSPWYFVIVILNLIVISIAIRYFQIKSLRPAFVVAIIYLVVGLLQSVLFYLFVILPMREIQGIYMISVIIILLASFAFAITLLISQTRNNHFLRIIGNCQFLLMGLASYILLLNLNIEPGNSLTSIIQVTKFYNLAISFLPLPLLFLFYYERKLLGNEYHINRNSVAGGYWWLLSDILTISMLFFGIRIGTQSYHKTHMSAETRRLIEPFAERTFKNDQDQTLNYRLLIPEDYDPERQYPLVVCLHGGAGWGKNNFRNVEGSLFARMLSQPINREKFPAMVFVPQCPPN